MALTVAAVTIVSACGNEATFPEDSFAVVANSDIGTGPSVIQVALIGPEGERLGSTDEIVQFEIAPADDPADTTRYDAEWVWTIPDVVGLYRSEMEVDDAGTWTVTVVPETGPSPAPAVFEVRDPTLAPNIGDLAPPAPTDTLASKTLGELTTDPNPDEDFYQITMEEAFGSGRMSVVVFSTPAFCRSATCGPTLDVVKEAKSEFPHVNYIHVEVYTDLNAPDFSPTPEFLAPAVGPDHWNLPSEPWVFVVDETGVITARFEGSLTSEDLQNALG
jgi:hypothetical protein